MVGGLLQCSLVFVPLFSTTRVIFRDMNADINLLLLPGWFLGYGVHIYPKKRCFLVLTQFFRHGLLDFASKQWHYLCLNKRYSMIRCAVNLLNLGLDNIRMMMPLSTLSLIRALLLKDRTSFNQKVLLYCSIFLLV